MPSISVKILFSIIASFVVLLICHNVALAATVADNLANVTSYVTNTLIPYGTAAGMSIGSSMWAFGSPRGVDIIKWSVGGGIVGYGGVETINAVLF